MLMYAIIGAVVCGIIMAVANAKAKKGVAWGMPVAILFGILAIGFSVWAICEQSFGKSDGEKTAEAWMTVRGTGTAQWLKTNLAGKKLLVVKGPAYEGRTDAQFEALKAGLDGVTYEVFEMPAPKSPEENGGMPPEMMYGPGGGKLTGQMKQMAMKEAKSIQEAIAAKVSEDKYDTVVFFTSVPEFLYFKSSGLAPIKAFDKKDLFFFYQPSMGMNPEKVRFPKEVIGYVTDKSLSNPDDYDKPPQGEQDKDFETRYEVISLIKK